MKIAFNCSAETARDVSSTIERKKLWDPNKKRIQARKKIEVRVIQFFRRSVLPALVVFFGSLSHGEK
jgi:hypothetical protein